MVVDICKGIPGMQNIHANFNKQFGNRGQANSDLIFFGKHLSSIQLHATLVSKIWQIYESSIIRGIPLHIEDFLLKRLISNIEKYLEWLF